VSLSIGKPFRGGLIGGVGPVALDYGALAFDAATGAVNPNGDVQPTSSLASFGKTALAAVGVDPGFIDQAIIQGSVVRGALA
jgi:hypothetical protein